MVKIFAKNLHSGIFVFFGFLITLETCLWVRMSSWDVYLMCFGRTSIESVSIWHSERLIHQVCWSHPLHEVARDNSRPENWWVYIDKLSSHDVPMIHVWRHKRYRYCFGSSWTTNRNDGSLERLESWFTPECKFFAKILTIRLRPKIWVWYI